MSDRRILVSVDVGNSNVKVVGPGYRTSAFPSVIADATSVLDDFDALERTNGQRDLVVGYEGRTYAVGRTAWDKGMNRSYLADRSRLNDPIYRILFAAALTRIAQENCVVDTIFSMPVSWYFDREKAKDALSGKYTVRVGKDKITYTVPRETIMVIPEGFGSVVYHVFNEQGRIRDESLTKQSIGVVDIGGLTIDYILFRSGLEIVQEKSMSSTAQALMSVWKHLGRRISREYQRDFEPHELDKIVKERHFWQGRKQVFVDKWIDEALDSLADVVNREIATLWSGGAEVQTIVVTGGGATFLYPRIAKKYDAAITVSDQPYLANCLGAYRFALMRQRKKG